MDIVKLSNDLSGEWVVSSDVSERERDEKEGEEEEPKGDSTTQKQDLWYHSITMQLQHIAVTHWSTVKE